VVVHTVLQGGLTPEQIDEAVRRQAAAGGSLYFVDLAQLQAIEPDVIVTQDLCHVCALSAPDLAIALRELRSKPLVISLSPHTLEQVFADIETVAAAVGRSEQGSALVDELRQRVTRVRQRAGTTPGPRVLCLECWRRSTRAATGSRR
jgi:iron complex transport system substrate-binding protein